MPVSASPAISPRTVCKWHRKSAFLYARNSSHWFQRWQKKTNFRSKVQKFGIAIGSIFLCGSGVYLQVMLLNENLPSFGNVSNMDRESATKHWHPSERLDDLNTGPVKAKPRGDKLVSFLPWLVSQSVDHWNLLRLAQSQSRIARIIGIDKLSREDWQDCQYREIRQAADYRTFIGLARSQNVDMRFFLDPPQLSNPKKDLIVEMQELLSSLPVAEDPCIGYFTSTGLQKNESRDLGRLFWNLENTDADADMNKDNSANSELNILECLLEALLRHSTIGKHSVQIVHHGGLALLRRALDNYPDNFHLHQLCARILGNLALRPELHEDIVKSGWVSILVKWMQSINIDVCLNTARALANLDIDSSSAMYYDGIYVLHPINRSRKPIYADIVFIHGLLGGPFKTWRQGGLDHRLPAELDELLTQGEYTKCWPKDWLPRDCEHVRILTVEYDTYLSELSATCPFDREKRSLHVRAKTILHKLRKAGVGEHPIIFVGHSMGGLLIKQMLLLDETMEKKVLKKTKGIIFYSVPHRGSTLATLWRQAWFLLYPSIEVNELDPDSLLLRTLHKNFQELIVESDIECVSFGELQKTPLGMRLHALIVPPHSSDPGFGAFYTIEANHLTICKPMTHKSLLYVVTLQYIQNWANQTLVESVMKAGLSIEDQVANLV